MLQTLKIKNFALIADQTIEFAAGFNVLVGETGAGKSLILDALSFVLGEKSNKLNIRHGEQKMMVQAVFDADEAINLFLNENDVDVCENIIISRSLTVDGKSDCRINGCIVPVSILKSMAELIVDEYAQNENVELLKVKNHILILDEYGGEEIAYLKNKIALLLSEFKEIDLNMQKLGGSGENRQRELELLAYQINDIESAQLIVGEDEKLKQDIDRLSNYEKIFECVKMAKENLVFVDEKLFDIEHSLVNAERYDDSLSQLIERVKSAKIELKDINETLGFLNDDSFDQSLLDGLNKRFDEIKLLKKKYGSTIEDVLNYLISIKENYDNLLYSEEKLEKLNRQKEMLMNQIYDNCVLLSEKRRVVALSVEQEVLKELLELGFKNCKFAISFKPIPKLEDVNITKLGFDDVEFLFSANAGEELKSLSKTISGGEMSRFMLAIKNVFANCFNSSVLVFDEVDTGISGEIGQRVAQRLATLSKKYQLICITHLCQVTAMADNYIFVKKDVENDKTFTNISYLQGDEIIQYIAVVSGAEPTEVAIRFATELKQKADDFKNSI